MRFVNTAFNESETGRAVALEKQTMKEGEMRHGAHSDEQWELRE